MSTRLQIREIGQGLVEIVAIGTAVKPAPAAMAPSSAQLIPQALILDRSSREAPDRIETLGIQSAPMELARSGLGSFGGPAIGCVVVLVFVFLPFCFGLVSALAGGG